ncbi:MAG: hypothetical protein CMF39_01930 [Legionellaceae bacterium]|nr:hypothetical protein [Legionellaceae bacterium]
MRTNALVRQIVRIDDLDARSAGKARRPGRPESIQYDPPLNKKMPPLGGIFLFARWSHWMRTLVRQKRQESRF